MDAGERIDAAALERKARRASMPIRVFRLGQEPGEDLSATTTAQQRLDMMWVLAVQAWTLEPARLRPAGGLGRPCRSWNAEVGLRRPRESLLSIG